METDSTTEALDRVDTVVRRLILIDCAKKIHRHADMHVEKWLELAGTHDDEMVNDAKATAIDMLSGAAPLLEELGMTWPDIMQSV